MNTYFPESSVSILMLSMLTYERYLPNSFFQVRIVRSHCKAAGPLASAQEEKAPAAEYLISMCQVPLWTRRFVPFDQTH